MASVAPAYLGLGLGLLWRHTCSLLLLPTLLHAGLCLQAKCCGLPPGCQELPVQGGHGAHSVGHLPGGRAGGRGPRAQAGGGGKGMPYVWRMLPCKFATPVHAAQPPARTCGGACQAPPWHIS
jgi:hypothetical protein